MNVMKWLLDSDPAIRWQVMRDLTEEDEPVITAERSRVATEGWGARVLRSQSSRGYWGVSGNKGWMITVHTLTLLKDLGADPQARQVRKAIDRVRKHVSWIRQTLLRRRDRTVYQRPHSGDRRIFWRAEQTVAESAAGRAAEGWWVEL